MMVPGQWHVFISHSSDDKEEIARPLALALRRRGLDVWFDEFVLRPGDSLREGIDEGIAKSTFGVIILSPSFLAKKWTKAELSAFFSKQISGTKKTIVPIWHNVSGAVVQEYVPLLGDRLALNSDVGLPALVESILEEVHFSSESPDVRKVAPTGIPRLDQALRGGIPRTSRMVIQGPRGIGKTTLALQIQVAALDRMEPCLYIAYRHSPIDILSLLHRLSAPVVDYVASGHFRILDNFSAFHDLSPEEVAGAVPDPLLPAIVRVENPADAVGYYKLQVELMEEMGFGGVNVIDATNERYKMFPPGASRVSEAEKYFQRVGTRLGRMEGQIGLHVVSESTEPGFDRILANIEDGCIVLRESTDEIGKKREIRVEHLRDGGYDDKWFEFRMGRNGIEVF